MKIIRVLTMGTAAPRTRRAKSGTAAGTLAQSTGLTPGQARDVVTEATFWLCPDI